MVSGRGPATVTFVALALIVLLSTRQVYAVYALKGLSPAQVALILVGALGVYWVLSGHRLALGARGLAIAILLSLIHISEPTRPLYISYAVFCLKKPVASGGPRSLW